MVKEFKPKPPNPGEQVKKMNEKLKPKGFSAKDALKKKHPDTVAQLDKQKSKKGKEAVAKAKKEKAKTVAKTLKKLPKKNMGEGDEYVVVGKTKGKLDKNSKLYKELTTLDLNKSSKSKDKPKKKIASRGGGAGEEVMDI